MTFDSFVGNHRIIERLTEKLRQKRFPHGVIFSGPEGVGKHTGALMIAQALNCTNAAPGEFCGQCSSCMKIESGSHPDVSVLTVEEDASEIKIAQVRDILGRLDLQPLEGRNKVYIIDPAEAMNPAAANALLKALEEPPENTHFLLITVNVQELLITVRSRTQIYNFTPLTLEEIRRNGINDELAVRWSQGSIGRARRLDVSRLRSDRAPVFDFLEVMLTAKEPQFQDLIGASADLGRAKNEFEDRMGMLAMLVADLLYLKAGAPERIVNIDICGQLQKLADCISIERLLAVSDFLRFIENSLKHYVNRQMLADMLALTGNERASSWL
jgi:DNA polymerase-3 subunit delta'